MRYIVCGGGRTGSHLVHEILLFLRPNYVRSFDFDTDAHDAFIHTNSTRKLAEYDPIRAKQETLLICRRRDRFSAAISVVVAQTTNEWFEYSDVDFPPFKVDVDVFLEILNRDVWYQHIEILKNKFADSIDVWFEDLISSNPMEQYICDLLGWRLTNSNPSGWARNKNPRDYTKLITNYNELHDVYLSTIDKNNKI